MSEPSARDALEIEVTDFGPIVKAKVELRPLTVFIGPSNTGKSYLATLIYALNRHFSADHGIRSWLGSFDLFGRKQPSKKAIDALLELARAFLNRQKHRSRDNVELPPPVAEWIGSRLNESGDALRNEIRRCFGIDDHSALIRKGRSRRTCITLRSRVAGDAPPLEHALKLEAKEAQLEMTLPDSIPIGVDDETIEFIKHMARSVLAASADAEAEDLTAYARERLMNALGHLSLRHIVGPLRLPAYYLPADRTGVMHAHSVVVSALIGRAPMAGLRPAARTPVLSGIMADFLEQLIELGHARGRRRKPERGLSGQIEDAVLGGSVHVDSSEQTGYPRFTYRPEGWQDDLSLMNASSMVSELAPVVLYLRHVIEPGNVLIIEEPESHLHPAMQVEFTRQLAVLVRSGVRVIVTTHSEWLLEELANIVQRSKPPNALATGEDHGQAALDRDEVGAWLFEPKKRPRGSVVQPIDIDESGLYPAGYDEVALALHKDWVSLSSENGNDS